jgi:uncharacterized membrane protein
MTGIALAKIVHLLGAMVLLGTGAGIAYFQWMAYRSRDIRAIRVTTRNVVLADAWFTAPAVVVQPFTGIYLMSQLGLSFGSAWFVAVAALYVVVGACWLPVVAIQMRMRRLADQAPSFEQLPDAFHRAFRRWTRLGIPAFAGTLALLVLMVLRPGMATMMF